MSSYRRRMIVYGNSGVDGYQIPQVRMLMGSYLDTGYKPNNTTKVECGLIPLSKSYYSILFKGNTANDTDQYGIQYASTVNTIYISCEPSLISGTTNKTVDLRPTVYYEIEFSQDILKVNGTSYTTGKSGTFQSQGTMKINYDPNESGLVCNENIWYYFKIYDNNILVRDYVPWKRTDGTVGMLDKVNNKFYTSETDVAFTDNTITLPEGYTRLEYISATGEQRFNTSITANYQTNFLAKCTFKGDEPWKNLISSKASNTSRRFELYNGNSTTSNSKIGFGYNNGGSDQTVNHANIDYTFIKGENYFYGFRQGSYSFILNRTRISFTCPTVLTIGCANTNGSYGSWFVGNIYEIEIFGGAHYIPCLNSNGIAGMYDVLNNEFKHSETGTEFVAGTVYGT